MRCLGLGSVLDWCRIHDSCRSHSLHTKIDRFFVAYFDRFQEALDVCGIDCARRVLLLEWSDTWVRASLHSFFPLSTSPFCFGLLLALSSAVKTEQISFFPFLLLSCWDAFGLDSDSRVINLGLALLLFSFSSLSKPAILSCCSSPLLT